MKNIFWIISIVAVFLSQPAFSSNIESTYLNHPNFKLKSDNDFGKDTAWSDLFFKQFVEIAVSDDGSIYATNSRAHRILKFDRNGRHVATFGKKGEGPGDLVNPGSPSILDNRYLVVDEYALRRRISIFHLNGKFFKLIKTGGSVFGCCALKNGKIAYLSKRFPADEKKEKTVITRVYIQDVNTMKKKIVREYRSSVGKNRIRIGKVGIYFGTTKGSVLLARTSTGNLIVAKSDTAKIEIFDPDGRNIRQFNLDFQRTRITQPYLDALKSDIIRQYQKRGANHIVKAIRKADLAQLFQSHHPYYKYLAVDHAGNLLFFTYREVDQKDGKIPFEIYTVKGEHQGHACMHIENLQLGVDSRFQRMIFSKKALFAYTGIEDEAGDIDYRIFKFNLAAKQNPSR